MMLRKWNNNKKIYEPYQVPNTWKVSLYEIDMDKIVNCANCGKELKFGECYTSKTIHTEIGMGYGVCEECYNKEEK